MTTPMTPAITRLYDTVFDRAPDAGGLQFWEMVGTKGFTLGMMAGQFMQAPEFADTYGQPDDLSFVRSMYRNVLDRPGEAEGVSFWTSALDGGRADRAGIVVAFSESAEHVQQMAVAAASPAQPETAYHISAPGKSEALAGAAGVHDVFVFWIGDAHDTIVNLGAEDTIKFADGIQPSDVQIMGNKGDITHDFAGSGADIVYHPHGLPDHISTVHLPGASTVGLADHFIFG